jgi:2-polyprenyl-3-methyl-5-hydroxy-6-metoxy-1,4-benzoquinol methylase
MSTAPPYDFRSKYLKTNWITRRLLEGFFGEIETMVRGLPLSSVVEIGCGEGFSTQRIRKFLPPQVQFEASDVEDRLVEAARRANPDVVFRRESIYEMERPARSVDLVFVLEVLEHLQEPARAMEQACRLSRRWVLASVPREPLWRLMNLGRGKYWARGGNTPGHVQHWTSRGFSRFMGRYGCVVAVRRPIPWTIVLVDLTADPRRAGSVRGG